MCREAFLRIASGGDAGLESALAPTTQRHSACSARAEPVRHPADQLLRSSARSWRRTPTKKTPSGVYFGEPEDGAGPFFAGEGPTAPAVAVRSLMVGSRTAQNSRQNYLYLAKARRTRDGRAAVVESDRSLARRAEATRWKACARAPGCARTARAARAASSSSRRPAGQNKLLARCRVNGSLRASKPLGSSCAPTRSHPAGPSRGLPPDLVKRSRSLLIYPDANTHIETVTYGEED